MQNSKLENHEKSNDTVFAIGFRYCIQHREDNSIISRQGDRRQVQQNFFRNTHNKLMELLCNKTATTSPPTTEAPCSQALPPTLYCETTSSVVVSFPSSLHALVFIQKTFYACL